MKFLLLIAFAVFLLCIIRKKRYKNTEYYRQTKHSYKSVQADKGRLGEFYIYKYLKPLKGYKRYLFNLYIPKENGETTEIDVVLLHESGIYVFESKNYSGWIYGTESEQYWTQTFPAKRGHSQENQFFNPILQNRGHLRWLRAFLADRTLSFYSYIVFSDRCTFKSITLTSGRHCVVHWHNLLSAIQRNVRKAGAQLSWDNIDDLYKKLYPLTQVDKNVKLMHIRTIERKRREA